MYDIFSEKMDKEQLISENEKLKQYHRNLLNELSYERRSHQILMEALNKQNNYLKEQLKKFKEDLDPLNLLYRIVNE